MFCNIVLGSDFDKTDDIPDSLLSTTQTYVMGINLCLGGLIMKPAFGNSHLVKQLYNSGEIMKI